MLGLVVAACCAFLASSGPPPLGSRPRLRGGQVHLGAQPESCSPAVIAGLSDDEAAMTQWLAAEQAHLIAGWETASVEDKRRMLEQLRAMDANYPADAAGRRGLAAYVAHARELLADSAANKNPFEGYTVDVPSGARMEIGSAEFLADEAVGTELMANSVFVLVAGGLGERLGYNGIKVALPAETLTHRTFLETYVRSIRAAHALGGGGGPPPHLVIMTSADTHDLTAELLAANDNFGLPSDRLHLLRQSNVPALDSNSATFAQDPADPFTLLTKPHGHGDVHTLPYTSGLLPRFREEGRKYLVLFQDTNVLAFKARYSRDTVEIQPRCAPPRGTRIESCRHRRCPPRSASPRASA